MTLFAKPAVANAPRELRAGEAMSQKADVALLALGPGGLPRSILVAAGLLGTNPPAPDLEGWLRVRCVRSVRS